jgi:hypothetical protein
MSDQLPTNQLKVVDWIGSLFAYSKLKFIHFVIAFDRPLRFFFKSKIKMEDSFYRSSSMSLT